MYLADELYDIRNSLSGHARWGIGGALNLKSALCRIECLEEGLSFGVKAFTEADEDWALCNKTLLNSARPGREQR